MSSHIFCISRRILILIIFSVFVFPAVAEEKHAGEKSAESAYQGAGSPIESAKQVITPGAPMITAVEFEKA